ncbi:MAG TPA: DUF5134 domain-containing protein [Pseudonocardia sp.]|jgi:hypothetical protein|nr:DUF5134 domain-containing protein [Pseudonocardia sp.]
MPSWLGVGLAATFALVAVHRGARRDVPGSLMAAGMAVMSVGMAGIGPMFVHGPWWAAGFLAVAVWPLASPRRAGQVCGGPLAHLLGGVAMIYMCALPAMQAGAGPTALTADTVALAPTGHHGMAMGPINLPGATQLDIPGPLGAALSVLGWGLACYFLLGTVTALTRRNVDGALTAPRLAVLGEAAMGFGTVVMLIAFT